MIGRALDRVPGDRVPGDRVPGGRVHPIGHSFGGLVAVAVALRRRVPLASLTIVEAPAVELLHDQGEARLYEDFRRMTDAYFAAYEAGNRSAIAAMIGISMAVPAISPVAGARVLTPWKPRRLISSTGRVPSGFR